MTACSEPERIMLNQKVLTFSFYVILCDVGSFDHDLSDCDAHF